MSLGVVVPCRGQEAFLPRTLAALERALAGEDWSGALVMASPASAPVKLVPRWSVIAPPLGTPLTPGGARMLGFSVCGGDHVLFVDADVEVDPAWVRAALARARGADGPGGVWGRIEEWFIDGAEERPGAADLLRSGYDEREVDYMTAVALYERHAFVAAGGYDARLQSEEDFELGMRLRLNGVRMVLLGMRAGRHWSAPRPSFAELVRRWQSGLCYGQGQVLRLYLGRPGFFRLLRRQGLYIAALLWWAAGLAALLAAVFGAGYAPLSIWAGLALIALATMILRKGSARVATLSVLTWTMNGAGMILGALRGPGVRAKAVSR